jgi:hypothetical protein
MDKKFNVEIRKTCKNVFKGRWDMYLHRNDSGIYHFLRIANSLIAFFVFHAKFDGKNGINYREKEDNDDIMIMMDVIHKLSIFGG